MLQYNLQKLFGNEIYCPECLYIVRYRGGFQKTTVNTRDFSISEDSMGRWVDLTGQMFGRLKVMGLTDSGGKQGCYWLCECTCGAIKPVAGTHLRRGNTKSCGCLQKELMSQRAKKKTGSKNNRYKHGLSQTLEFKAWTRMRNRCENERNRAYSRYGGRGIQICKRWQDFENFFEL